MNLDPPRLLQGKDILIAGSISKDAESHLAQRARDYVRALVRAVFSAGGNFIVYLSGEPIGQDGQPLTFDWLIVRELDTMMEGGQTSARLIVVMSEKNRLEKMNTGERQLLARLVARNAVEFMPLHDDTVTGGNIGDAQTDRADAMFAIGGGKGVLDRAQKLASRRVPVLPMDIRVGALSEDGAGALGLHRQFMSNPSSVMPLTGPVARNACLALSLEEPVQSLDEIAAGAVALVAGEMEAQVAAAKTDVLVLTALPIELAAAKAAFGIGAATAPRRTASGLNYWRSQLRRVDGSTATCDIACFAGAGNTNAAGLTASLLLELNPLRVVMLGIAAGMRGKCRLGQVVIAERVVAYEGAAVLEEGKVEARPESYQLDVRTRQDVAGYLADRDGVRSRLDAVWKEHQLAMPGNVDIGPVAETTVPDLTTIASGEQLLRDAVRFAELRELHGKIEVAEMEGAGVCAACSHSGVPALVLRGISDFGDATKDNRFHDVAAKAAGLLACDLIQYGLRP